MHFKLNLQRRSSKMGRLVVLMLLVATLGVGGVIGFSLIKAQGCATNAPIATSDAVQAAGQLGIPVPGHPFGVVVSPDGHWLFVTLQSSGAQSVDGIAVLHRDNQQVRLLRVIPLQSPAGLTITHDGDLLLVAAADGVAFVDASLAETGSPHAVLGSVHDGDGAGTIEVTLSQDERYAFATDENAGTVSVLDVQLARSAGYTSHVLIGQIPVDLGPVGITLSPDGNFLYITSEIARPAIGWTNFPLIAASSLGLINATGTLTVVDVARAEHDPMHAVVSRVAAGCNPVRVALSPDGTMAWVTARASNAVLTFSTSRLLNDSGHALLASTPTGPLPVGIILIDHGAVAVIANSNRRVGGQSPQTISLIDTAAVRAGHAATLGKVRVGAFPREFAVTPDGHTIFLTNANSDMLTVIDVTQLPALRPQSSHGSSLSSVIGRSRMRMPVA